MLACCTPAPHWLCLRAGKVSQHARFPFLAILPRQRAPRPEESLQVCTCRLYLRWRVAPRTRDISADDATKGTRGGLFLSETTASRRY